MMTAKARAKTKWRSLIEEVHQAQVDVTSTSPGAKEEGPLLPARKIMMMLFEIWIIFYKEKNKRLTCFAIPKSASFTRPLGSTNMFAPLMSLQIKREHNYRQR
jgi:hypothetical protein